MPILKEELDALSKYGVLKTALPEVITANHSVEALFIRGIAYRGKGDHNRAVQDFS
ncbi:MAG: hypothetical protein L6435_16225 [Anaerolineae bacterium]|nr:hypothetical protein [Anaerolineae bacterium]